MYRDFVLGFGVHTIILGGKRHVFLFPPRVRHGFVHAVKIPVHLGWMQEQASGIGMGRCWRDACFGHGMLTRAACGWGYRNEGMATS